MADNNFVVQLVKFYEFSQNSLWLSRLHIKQCYRFLFNITRKLSYTKDDKTKEGISTIYLNLTVAKALVDQMSLAYQLAQYLQDYHGAKIYNII